MCIEGANTIENILDMIEWLPKVGFNGYYIQFSLPYEFFERWLSHRDNPIKSPESCPVELVKEYHKTMIYEIKRRGLLLHAMGHGWQCFPFGIPDHGWYKPDPDTIPQSYKNLCAVLDGKREVWQNTPLATQLCYTNPFVKSTMVNAVIKYAEDHPEADVIYFWLGDYYNNTCECPECTRGTYADPYVSMANDITDGLVARGLKTKIVLSIGSNRSHPPKFTEIRNQENVILQMAPILRSFSEPFPPEYTMKEIPEYKVNECDLFGSDTPAPDKYLSYLYAWKQKYDGDVIDFDYHLMWDHILDAGGEGIARVAYTDIRSFDSLGINGFISCQLQRNAFPTSIVMTTMAKTLWDSNADFDEIRYDLYKAAYGEDSAELLCDYFATLSSAFDVLSIRGQRTVDLEAFRARMEAALEALYNIEGTILAHLDCEDDCHRESWKILRLHREAYILVGKAVIARIDRDEESYQKYVKEAQTYVWEHEDELQTVLDSMGFHNSVEDRITVNEAAKIAME